MMYARGTTPRSIKSNITNDELDLKAKQQVKNSSLYYNGRLKRSPYRTKSRTSEVDETLFGSPVRFAQQKETPHVTNVEFNPPWAVEKETKSTGFLMWSPTKPDKVTTHQNNLSPPALKLNLSRTGNAPRGKKSSTSCTPRNVGSHRPMSARSNKYRLKKHTDTFVDETLFATPRSDNSYSYQDNYFKKEKIPFVANSAWSSPAK